MVTMNRTSNAPYTIEYGYAEIKNIANEAKSVPRAWINERGNDVTGEMVAYLLPLIQGRDFHFLRKWTAKLYERVTPD